MPNPEMIEKPGVLILEDGQEFPGFLRTQIEQVRVASLHLRLDVAANLVGGEFAPLFRQDELPGEMEEKIADLAADRVGIVLADGLIEFVNLLKEIGAKRFPGLDSVPGAPLAKIGNHRHGSSQR